MLYIKIFFCMYKFFFGLFYMLCKKVFILWEKVFSPMCEKYLCCVFIGVFFNIFLSVTIFPFTLEKKSKKKKKNQKKFMC